MRPISKTAVLACALMLGGLSAIGCLGVAGAQDESEPVKSALGGPSAKTARHQFEVLFYTTGLRIFPLNSAVSPLDDSKLTGIATFSHPNSQEPGFSRPLRSAQSACSLDLAIGLGHLPALGVKVTIAVDGLRERSERTATFTVPPEFVSAASPGCTVVSTQSARPRGGISPPLPSACRLGYSGLGDSLLTRRGTTSLRMSPSPVSLSGYGRVPSSPIPRGALPFVSGHAIFVMPSSGRDVSLARPWIRPMD